MQTQRRRKWDTSPVPDGGLIPAQGQRSALKHLMYENLDLPFKRLGFDDPIDESPAVALSRRQPTALEKASP